MSFPFRLPEIAFPLTVDTIGKMLALGDGAHIHCQSPGCRHSSRLNLVALGRRVGFDHSCTAQDLRRHFYCPECRAAGRDDKRIGLIHLANNDKYSRWPRD